MLSPKMKRVMRHGLLHLAMLVCASMSAAVLGLFLSGLIFPGPQNGFLPFPVAFAYVWGAITPGIYLLSALGWLFIRRYLKRHRENDDGGSAQALLITMIVVVAGIVIWTLLLRGGVLAP